ncbi:hypothetical protein B9Z55_022175 [Caenorhabditis nigoni]|uniref:Integrin beta N-terminal domain-containing protein n=1 Tax=Caenorhabditis nigoni TaxID=1611254 RepID=A0A2G5SJE7_9PELO|nr:hypothetical protein B9Z55_022175 [Caenorhabditis nigoni]
MHSPVRILLCLALFLLKSSLSDETPDQLCNNLDAQQSCGQCIKAHAECAWCIDPVSQRYMFKSIIYIPAFFSCESLSVKV